MHVQVKCVDERTRHTHERYVHVHVWHKCGSAGVCTCRSPRLMLRHRHHFPVLLAAGFTTTGILTFTVTAGLLALTPFIAEQGEVISEELLELQERA